jgi:hypothetical protein
MVTEPTYREEGLLSELPGRMSREAITVLSGQNITKPMTVLGKVTVGAATSAAYAGNTGNGTMGAVTLSAGAKPGVYKLTIIEPGSNVGTFLVEDPDGIIVGRGVVATAYSAGGLAFTLADDSTDFIAGDGFNITVAAGSGKYVKYNQDATNGSQLAAGIAIDVYDATSADVDGAALVRGCEVADDILTWPSDIESGEKTAAIAQLAALNPPILVRTAI